MNKRKMTFIFLAGFWLHEVMVHLWLTLDGMLPLTSKFAFGITITPELNLVLIAVNIVIFLILANYAFLHTWTDVGHRTTTAAHR